MKKYTVKKVDIKPIFTKGIRHYLDREFLNVEEVVKIIKEYGHIDASKKKVRVVINGRKCKITSQRLRVFAKSTVCIDCGVSGAFFSLETDIKGATPHLNLYAENHEGEYELMTKDHTIPKSKGGQDIMSNYETMCAHCNSLKGSEIR